jgi:hypothetical protein
MIHHRLACATPRRVPAIALACSVAALELCCVILIRPLADLPASHLLGYELVVIPGFIAVAGLVGSIIGEASLVSRSPDETLRRETHRRRHLEHHLGALRVALAGCEVIRDRGDAHLVILVPAALLSS